MAIDFPTTPSINDIYTFNGKSWKWSGTAWDAVPGPVGYTGSIGYVGSRGVIGYTGSLPDPVDGGTF